MMRSLEVRERRAGSRNVKNSWLLGSKGVVVGEEVGKMTLVI